MYGEDLVDFWNAEWVRAMAHLWFFGMSCLAVVGLVVISRLEEKWLEEKDSKKTPKKEAKIADLVSSVDKLSADVRELNSRGEDS